MTRPVSAVVHEVLENIHYTYDEAELADTVLKTVAHALNAEAGTVFILRDDQTLYPMASFEVPVQKLRRVKIALGQGIAGWVAQYAQPAKTDEAADDPRFFKDVDRTTGFKTRNIIAAPILTRGKAVGVIEFLNRRDGPFSAQDLELISMIGREIGIAFENVRLVRRLEGGAAFQDALLRSLTAGLILLDPAGRVDRLNPAAEHILSVDFQPSSSPPSPAKALPGLAPLVRVLDELVKADEPTKRQELRLKIRGRPAVLGYSAVPVYGKDGTRLGSALLFQDITAFVE